MFELNQNEIILKPQNRPGVRGLGFTHIVRKPTDEDWYTWDYHRLPRMVTRTDNMDVVGNEAKAYELIYDGIAIRVEGKIDGRSINKKSDWRKLVPLLEKRRVVRTFSQVQAVELGEEDEEQLYRRAPSQAQYFVKLIAGAGTQLYYTYYCFGPVSAGHIKEFEARSQLWRTKFEGNKILMIRHNTVKPLATLCRELVVHVYGYGWRVDGELKDVTELPDWKEKLDALHCMIAVQQLFSIVQEEYEANFPSTDPFASTPSKGPSSPIRETRES